MCTPPRKFTASEEGAHVGRFFGRQERHPGPPNRTISGVLLVRLGVNLRGGAPVALRPIPHCRGSRVSPRQLRTRP